MFTPNIIPNKRTEPSRIKREMTRKKVSFDAVCFPLVLLEKKNKKKIYLFCGKYQKYFISCVENIRKFTRATHS